MPSTARKSTTSTKNTRAKKSTTTKRSSSNNKSNKNVKNTKRNHVDYAIKNEVLLIALLAFAIFIFLCVINLIQGSAANVISDIMFGLFGLLAYIIPIIVFLGFAFGISNKGNTVAIIKIISAVILIFLLGILSFIITKQNDSIVESELIKSLYSSSKNSKSGAGVIFGLLGFASYKLVGFWGTLFIALVLLIICIVFITERSFLSGMKKGSNILVNAAKNEHQRRKEYFESIENFEDEDFEDPEKLEELCKEIDAIDDEPKLRRIDKKVKGVSNVTLDKANTKKSDIHEITLDKSMDIANEVVEDDIHIVPEVKKAAPVAVKSFIEKDFEVKSTYVDESDEKSKEDFLSKMPDPVTERNHKKKDEIQTNEDELASLEKKIDSRNEIQKEYKLPPIDLLNKVEKKHSDTDISLKETAYRLQQTLLNFGVNVTVTDISQGPTVTRFELQPEQGVKVSKIKSLEDDIKLNLATTDIRIEAPIPGKAAVGIEVPNKENSAVSLRELFESKEFKNSSANLTFAVGKDIGGQVVITDIAKMPHLLIAGATGSGKSVCINTIIMSLLYKANPNDVKLIMIDPKVVELSVYNKIPHLLTEVVTDPKKAAATLQWAVNEMSDRYQKFADYNVRDLKGYNQLVSEGKCDDAGNPLKKMPQLVIIVDELADLMMVASGEVEESICRLAQLARAAGIHLIIATQRPSVDVITGLIKANMPSRIAFSVSSGVDSRTILDMNGAEKLLGKGDMLFYPQGFSKPSRVQGAFVSDSEVSKVVDYLKNQKLGNVYDEDVAQKINSSIKNVTDNNSSSGSEYDQYFADAGKLILEKDKASIGMLQRAYKIGFNRAARIMDQLESVGAVSAEEGTKPRKVLMSPEQFENLLEEIL